MLDEAKNLVAKAADLVLDHPECIVIVYGGTIILAPLVGLMPFLIATLSIFGAAAAVRIAAAIVQMLEG